MLGTVTAGPFYRQLVSRVSTTAGQDSPGSGAASDWLSQAHADAQRRFGGSEGPKEVGRLLRASRDGLLNGLGASRRTALRHGNHGGAPVNGSGLVHPEETDTPDAHRVRAYIVGPDERARAGAVARGR